MAKRGALVVKYIGDTRDLERSNQRATSTIRKMRGPALGVAAGIGAIAVSSVKLEKQFSQNMNMVAAATGSPKKEMAKLQALAIKLGKDTSFSANEAGEAMLELAKGGMSAATIRAGGLKGTLQLAAAGGTDLATAATIASNSLNMFGLKGKQMSMVAAALAGGANASSASVESLGQALSQVGPGARNAGLSLNETVGALAAFDQAGIKGSDSGTSLKTMLARLVPNTKKARDAMKDLGLKFTDAKGNFLPLTNIAQQLQDKMGGLSQKQRTLAMNTIFGSDATRAATVLMNEGAKGLGKYIKATKDRGAAEDMANARMKGTAGALERLSGSWETLRLTLGLMVAPAITFIADRMSGLTNFMTNNSKAVMIAVGIVGAFAVAVLAINGAMSVATSIAKAWTVVTKVAVAAQWALNVAMRANPIGLVITAVTALVAALVWFFTKTKVGQAIVRNAWSGIKSAIKGVADWWTKTAWPAIKAAVSAMGSRFRMVGRVVGRVWRSISDAMGSAWDWINKNVFRPIKLGMRIIGMVFRLYGRVLRSVWSNIVDALGRAWRWINKKVFRPIRSGVRYVADVFRTAGRGIARIWGWVSDALGRGWRWVNKKVFIPFRRGLTVLRLAFRIAKDRIGDYFGRMRDKLQNVGSWIRKNVFGRLGFALRKIRNGFKDAVSRIGEHWARLKRAAARPVNFLIKWVWNRGLRAVLNKIPGVNLGEVKPIKFAKGGHRGPGAVTGGIRGRDSVPAWYMPGEHVWTEREVRAVGGQKVMYGMRKAALRGELEFAKGGSLSSMRIAQAQAFAKRQAGKPYGWGAVGPSAYDCSGFMSALTNVLRGRSPYSRVGSTASFPWGGFVRGPGQFTIGSSKNFSGGIGHMAGNLAGLGVESRGGRGVIIGGGAMSPSRFAGQWHLGSGGGKYGSGGGGNWWDDLSSLIRALRKLPGQIREMLSGGSWIGTFIKKAAVAVAKNVANWINKKIPDIGPIKTNPIKVPKFDNGGTLSPGFNTVYNGLGRPEPLRRADAGGGDIYLTVEIGGQRLGELIINPIRHEVRTKGGGNVQAYLGRR